MADVFISSDVRKVFREKKVLFLGDSIMRNLYQDFVYLVEKGDLTPNAFLKKKGVQVEEGMFPGDSLKRGTGEMTTGRDFREVREYRSTGRENVRATFNFLTRCYDAGLARFLEDFRRDKGDPDLILVLSALWDINRWGPSGISDYKKNCKSLLEKVKTTFGSSTQLVWLTSPPISVDVWGGLMVEGMDFLKHSMRFNVMEGNLMVALNTAAAGFDVVDLHYWMTHQIHKRMPDGIHWTQDAVRLQLNIILTHFCLSRDLELPGRWGGEANRPLESAKRIAEAATEERVEDGEGPASKRRRVEECEEEETDSNCNQDSDEVEVGKRELLMGENTEVQVEGRLAEGWQGREVLVCHHPSVPRELWSVKEARVKVGAGGRLPVTVVVRAVGIVVLEEDDLLAQIVLA